MAEPPTRESAIRRVLIGYLLIVGLLCGGFALGAVSIVDTADRERVAALIDIDVADTVDRLTGPEETRRDRALAVVRTRGTLGDERIYGLSERGAHLAGVARARFRDDGNGWLASADPQALARAVTIAPGVEMLIGRRLAQGRLTHALLLLGALVLLAAVAAAAAVGLWAGRSLTVRIDAINRACDRVRLGDFGARAPVPAGHDEFARLAGHVNAMLEQIDALVMGLRDVSNRVAHELRTPVARLKSDLEEAAAAPDLRTARELAGAAAAETDEILQTFEALLDIAEVEAGGAGGLAPMRLDEAVRAACELYESVAEAAGVKLAAALDPVTIIGERTLIVRLAANLIDNAIKFSAAGSAVAVRVAEAGGEALLEIADRGPGIAEGERERVLGRFARGRGASAVRGHGLGLALVSAVAKRHGAPITMSDAEPGLRVAIRFSLSRLRSG